MDASLVAAVFGIMSSGLGALTLYILTGILHRLDRIEDIHMGVAHGELGHTHGA